MWIFMWACDNHEEKAGIMRRERRIEAKYKKEENE